LIPVLLEMALHLKTHGDMSVDDDLLELLNTTIRRYNRKLWIVKMTKAAYPWSDQTPASDGGSRRGKDTPCSSLPHVPRKDKPPRSEAHWMIWPGKELVA
jgi:hypothetical protein